MNLDSMKKNWRTSALGVSMILAGIGNAGMALLDSDPVTNVDWKVTGTLLAGGWGLLMAKDGVVTGGTVPATNEAAARTVGA